MEALLLLFINMRHYLNKFACNNNLIDLIQQSHRNNIYELDDSALLEMQRLSKSHPDRASFCLDTILLLQSFK
jgi:hypothetical protein